MEHVTAAESWPLDSLTAVLDDHHDRRTRIQRASKAITENSKKIIFALHRHQEGPRASLWASSRALFAEIEQDITGVHAHEYDSVLTGAIQESVEAALFEHYLKTQKLMALHVVNESKLPSYAPASLQEYLLGIMDLTGELMRYVIVHINDSDSENETPRDTLKDDTTNINPIVAQIHAFLLTLDTVVTPRLGCDDQLVRVKELGQKMKTFRASLEKVNRAIYGLGLRQYERAKLAS